jgi:hypothetical protein
MRNWLGIAAALGVASTLPMACSSSTPVPFQTVSDFCTAKAQAECQIAPRCSIATPTCEEVRDQLCLTAAAEATSGTRTYTQPNAQACINAVNAAYSQGNTSGQILYATLYGTGSVDDVCNRVFQGTEQTDAPCTTDYDCVNNGVCSEVPGASQSVCAPPEPADAGQFCANPGTECATGTYCAASATGGAPICTARVTMGGVCSSTTLCLETLRCVDATCVAREETGGACTTDDDCSPTAPYCDTYAGGICTVGLEFATGASDCKGFEPGATDAGMTPPPVEAGSPEDSATPEASGGG